MAPFPVSSLRIAGCEAETTEREARGSQLERDVVDLFDQFRHRLLRHLLGLGLTVHDAEEVVQEVFLSLFQHLRRGGSSRNLRGWIFRVAHNLGLKQCNRNRAWQQQFVDAGNVMEELHADPGSTPEEQTMSGERQKRLRSVLRALPEQDRWCLCLRAEGLRYREIAEVLGMSLGAVSLSLGRSLARLARADER